MRKFVLLCWINVFFIFGFGFTIEKKEILFINIQSDNVLQNVYGEKVFNTMLTNLDVFNNFRPHILYVTNTNILYNQKIKLAFIKKYIAEYQAEYTIIPIITISNYQEEYLRTSYFNVTPITKQGELADQYFLVSTYPENWSYTVKQVYIDNHFLILDKNGKLIKHINDSILDKVHFDILSYAYDIIPRYVKSINKELNRMYFLQQSLKVQSVKGNNIHLMDNYILNKQLEEEFSSPDQKQIVSIKQLEPEIKAKTLKGNPVPGTLLYSIGSLSRQFNLSLGYNFNQFTMNNLAIVAQDGTHFYTNTIDEFQLKNNFILELEKIRFINSSLLFRINGGVQIPAPFNFSLGMGLAGNFNIGRLKIQAGLQISAIYHSFVLHTMDISTGTQVLSLDSIGVFNHFDIISRNLSLYLKPSVSFEFRLNAKKTLLFSCGYQLSMIDFNKIMVGNKDLSGHYRVSPLDSGSDQLLFYQSGKLLTHPIYNMDGFFITVSMGFKSH